MLQKENGRKRDWESRDRVPCGSGKLFFQAEKNKLKYYWGIHA